MTKEEALKLARKYTVGGLEFDAEGLALFVALVIDEEQRKWEEQTDIDIQEQEPVVGLQCANCHLTIESLNDKVMRLMQERNFCSRCGKRTADLTTIHTCTPPHDNALQRGLSKTKEVVAGSQAFYGFPHGPVSTPNAGGKCVTDGKTSP